MYTNSFELVEGSIPHICYSLDKGVDFAIDKYGTNGWLVVVHHTRGWGYVEVGKVGAVVNNELFISDLYSAEGTGDVFRVAFRWWPTSQGISNSNDLYGWFALGTENGELVILASEVSDEEGAVTVGYPTEDETGGQDESDDPSDDDSDDPKDDDTDDSTVDTYDPEVCTDTTDSELRSAEKTVLVEILGTTTAKQIYARADCEIREQDNGVEITQPADAVKVCVLLGISPIDTYISEDGYYLTATFRVPTLKISKFDPTQHTITGRIIPAEGTSIVHAPQSYAFGLNYIEFFGSGYDYAKPLGEWWPYTQSDCPIQLSLTNYLSTGEFTYTYEPGYVYDSYFPTIFQLVIGDYYYETY